MEIISNKNGVRGYKVFNPDWTCSPNGNTKQYTCPGRFEEEGEIEICGHGMHFCESAIDCFKYYDFNPDNKVAEVLAYGTTVRKRNIFCTDKLEIIREIPWEEVLSLVNTGKNCTGYGNTGDNNSGDYNTGNSNSGNYNCGNENAGNGNIGNENSGSYNTGSCNTGEYNTGSCNSGNCNTGSCNSGNLNTGTHNTGSGNSGNNNSGDYNTGDWNVTSHSSGCFNTQEEKITLFNKPSDWTYTDWVNSEACLLMDRIPMNTVKWIHEVYMNENEKKLYPFYKTTRGYLETNVADNRQEWWDSLSDKNKDIIRSIPNFDPDIFKECTGIKVD